MTFELAPAAVIRAAAWPVESLQAFGDEELARDVRARHVEDRLVGAGYDAAITREREALWERTAGDPRFMKALVLASAPLAERVQMRAGPAVLRDKRARHLDTSLYRYLARASTCTTPHGLWAGVTVARFRDEETTRAAPARVDFTPDLVPFAAALSALGERAPYREAALLRLSPTLRPRADGTWSFLARAFGGSIELREMRSEPTLGPLLERIGDAGTGTLRELATRANVPREMLELLQGSGALVGGLSFPTRFASTWEALEAAGDLLLGDDRGAWRRTVSALSVLCGRLAEDFDRLSATDLAVHAAKAHEPVAALLLTLGVDVPLRSPALRCDLRLPYAITLGPQTHRELLDGLAARDAELTASTRERRRALVARLCGGAIAIGDEIPALPPIAPDGAELSNASNPWGCLVARLGEEHVTHVIGIDDSPVRPFGRHSALLTTGHDVERWVEHLVARLLADHGVIACELAVPFERNPNVQARPNITPHSFEPWGSGGPDLRGAELRTESGALVLHVPSIGRVMVVAACSAISVPCDPMAGPFAVMGFSEAPDESPPRDVDRPASATALTGAALRELTKLPRRERYARWLDLAARSEWPERVSISIDGGRPLVVVTSSPLAIEAAFEGAGGASAVVVEAADLSARLVGPSGRHVADVSVPFSRTPHAFSALTPSGVPRES